MAFQIFISYARQDDRVPPEAPEAKGFVTVLYEHLRYHFDELGPPKPELWRDKRAIEPSDQFDPILSKAIENSSLLLVVLSLNWLDRPWCRRELELFAKRWRHEGDDGIRRRIVVVGRRHVDPDQRPSLLQGQQGYSFYEREPDTELGGEREFFRHGKATPEFFEVAEDLAKSLWRRAGAKPAEAVIAPVTASVASPAPARTIYVAKPAADMRPAYLRLVDELTNRQFAVTPPLEADIPHESEAEASTFIANAMRDAELSIHLVGEKLGYVPDEGDPIVKLQLRMADEHAADAASLPGFRRYIWAPAFLFDRDGVPLGTTERDPFEVLRRFDRLSPSDTIVGSEPTVFINDVVRYLEQSAKPLAPEPLQAGGEVYICHREDDTEWALEVAGALKEQQLGARFPAFDSDVAEVTNVHRRALESCDAVVLCWANAGEAWIKAQSAELKRWEDLGRERRFACRTVIAGPPPGMRKNVFRDFPPPNEIDLVIDLSANQEPTAQALGPLVRATRDLGPAEGPKPHAT